MKYWWYSRVSGMLCPLKDITFQVFIETESNRLIKSPVKEIYQISWDKQQTSLLVLHFLFYDSLGVLWQHKWCFGNKLQLWLYLAVQHVWLHMLLWFIPICISLCGLLLPTFLGCIILGFHCSSEVIEGIYRSPDFGVSPQGNIKRLFLYKDQLKRITKIIELFFSTLEV